MQQFIV